MVCLELPSVMFSSQVIYCNSCGKRFEAVFSRLIGRNFKVCSLDCHREIEWRDVLSTMGQPYTPDPAKGKEDKQ